MSKTDISSYTSFDEICKRLDSIISEVRDKETSLETSLDLFDEAIDLGSAAVDMVDVTELTASEKSELEQVDDASIATADAEADPRQIQPSVQLPSNVAQK